MSDNKTEQYADKHGTEVQIDETVAAKIRERVKEKQLPCAVAFDIAAGLGCEPAQIGQTADLLNLRLVKCQLGLFGYQPNKKIVKSARPEDPELQSALEAGAGTAGAISCCDAWELADRFKVSKMTVSAGCEALGIKVKPCQLGAF